MYVKLKGNGSLKSVFSKRTYGVSHILWDTVMYMHFNM